MSSCTVVHGGPIPASSLASASHLNIYSCTGCSSKITKCLLSNIAICVFFLFLKSDWHVFWNQNIVPEYCNGTFFQKKNCAPCFVPTQCLLPYQKKTCCFSFDFVWFLVFSPKVLTFQISPLPKFLTFGKSWSATATQHLHWLNTISRDQDDK